MALHHSTPYALCIAEPNASSQSPIPLVMKEDLHHHHHHHQAHHHQSQQSHHHQQQQQQQQQQHPGQQLQEYERLAKLPPTNGKTAWTDTATECLIDVYEEKWNSLRRGNLKAKNWDEVGAELGQRCGVPKTGDQCRHKIEKLRGRFRQEKIVANFNQSKWPWYDRLNMVFGDKVRLLREAADFETGGGGGGGGERQHQQQHLESAATTTGYHLHQTPQPGGGNHLHLHQQQQQHQGGGHHHLHHQHHHHERESVHEIPLAVAAPPHQLELLDCRPHADVPEDKPDDTSYSRKESTDREEEEEEDEQGTPKSKGRRKRARECPVAAELAAAMRSFGESLVKIEEYRMELQRDHERLVLDVETRRVQAQEVELKRTEMLVQMELKRTQMLYDLEIRRTKMQMEMFESLLNASKWKRSRDV